VTVTGWAHHRPMQPARTVNLGRGLVVPYPTPTTAEATRIGRANGRRDTRCERELRSALHAAGLRFRVDLLVRSEGLRVHVDIAFTRVRLAAFVDGCFWHGCPMHQHVPKRNRGYWVPKLVANVTRDRAVDAALRGDGWTIVRVWEHERVEEAARRIVRLRSWMDGRAPT
jgi:DNA mismatch endonuclease, patch repair protein